MKGIFLSRKIKELFKPHVAYYVTTRGGFPSRRSLSPWLKTHTHTHTHTQLRPWGRWLHHVSRCVGVSLSRRGQLDDYQTVDSSLVLKYIYILFEKYI